MDDRGRAHGRRLQHKLRGPYRPPQYRRVMLPMIVLRRLDCVLEPTKSEVLAQYEALRARGLSDAAVEKALAKTASKDRQQPLYNISAFTFAKLLGDPNGLARNPRWSRSSRPSTCTRTACPTSPWVMSLRT